MLSILLCYQLKIDLEFIGFEKENNKLKGIQYIPCIACKDFCKKEERLIPFDVIFTGISEDEKINYNKNNILYKIFWIIIELALT